MTKCRCLLSVITCALFIAGSASSVRTAAQSATSAPAPDVSFPRPPMGWASWNSFSNAFDSTVIQQQAQAMVSNGMKAAGYQYLLLDEGWWLGRRDAGGNIIVDKQQWPAIQPGEQAGDMANIVRYIHGLGLKAAIYTDAGEFGCSYMSPDIGPPQPHTGSLGHYQQDFEQFARWGFDYVKVDWCGGDKPNLDPALQYAEIARAITDAEKATGHRLFYSICDWGRRSPWTWAPGIGGITETMWRTGDDIIGPIVDDPMHADRSVELKNIFKNFDDGIHPEAQHTGFFNDLDMMVVGMRGTTDAMDRLHMSLWAISGAPLMVGADLTKLTHEQAAVLTNAEVLAIDQDRLGLQGVKVGEPARGLEVWTKPMAQAGEQAVVLLNRTAAEAAVSFDLEQVGLLKGSPAAVRDVWSHKDLAQANPSFSTPVPSGGAVLLLVRGRALELRQYKPVTGGAAQGTRNERDACAFCSAETDRRQYIRFTHVAATRPYAEVRIAYATRSTRPFAVMMQVNGETPTRVELYPAKGTEGVTTVQAPFRVAQENAIAFWMPEGGEPPVTSIALQSSR